jgi:hypothetical protein
MVGVAIQIIASDMKNCKEERSDNSIHLTERLRPSAGDFGRHASKGVTHG